VTDSLDFTTPAAPPPPTARPATAPASASPLARLQAKLATLDLSSMPRVSPVASRLAAMGPDDLESSKEFCALIEQEPICVARLIGLANSVAYGAPGKKFNNLEQAVLRIGLERAAQIAFGMLCGQAINKGLSPQWREFLWLHAIAVAHGASLLANKVNPQERANAYLAGMIYDIGTLVIECLQPGTLDLLLQTAENRGLKLGRVENAMLGKARKAVTHALLDRWSLPTEIVVGIAERDPGAIDMNSLSAILALADEMARSGTVLGSVYADTPAPFVLDSIVVEDFSPQLTALVSCGDADLEKITERLADQVQVLRSTAQSFSDVA
jgi:HD-like signal output (HDOD) protein